MDVRTFMDKNLEHTGKEGLLIITMEECSELIKEVSKIIRKNDNLHISNIDTLSPLAEEIADVELMTSQLKHAFNLEIVVEIEKQRKKERQLRRIEDEQCKSNR
ncbi:MAG: hypothetical protein PUK21_01420 [Peptostreptococcaceae bacterium]|nr:hypothetical protein [Peptostreptococcaceae bacterium]MDY5738668.1 hypothetical protein [Anaerovoracaceae bacterium]